MPNYKEKQEILADLEKRVADKILEQNNFDLLKKLVGNADTLDEAIKIAELGTTYKLTGFHFDKRLERQSNAISYFVRNNALSFTNDTNAITHKLISGDNYPALLNLLVEYKGKIDIIYIDPPYGKDSMGEFADTNYDNSLTRDNLLSMLYPRLWIAKQLLSDTGIIYCSIDDRNHAYVKCLFDEIFNESNFVASLVWKKKAGGGNDSTDFAVEHEYVLCYKKYLNGIGKIPLSDENIKGYKYSDDKEATHGKHGYKNLNDKSLSDSKGLHYDIVCPDGSILYGSENQWKCNEETFKKRLADNRIIFIQKANGEWTCNYKIYLNEEKGKLKYDEDGNIAIKGRNLSSIIDNILNKGGSEEIKSIFNDYPFDYPKPSKLIKQLLQCCTSKNAIVLDFFAGSGTTGQAVLDLNREDGGSRQFILVTLNEITSSTPKGIIINVTSKRLKRIMSGKCYDGTTNFDWIKKNKPFGGNLDVFDIAEVSNFEAVAGKTAFDVIDETLYGNKRFNTVKEKVEWVCNNFEVTQKKLEEK